MKTIKKSDLNRRKIRGGKVTQLRPVKAGEEEAVTAVARLTARQKADFAALADSIERTSTDVARIYDEVRTLKSDGGEETVQLLIHRGLGRLVKHVDIVKVGADGPRRYKKCLFNRDEIGDVSTIDIVPGV